MQRENQITEIKKNWAFVRSALQTLREASIESAMFSIIDFPTFEEESNKHHDKREIIHIDSEMKILASACTPESLVYECKALLPQPPVEELECPERRNIVTAKTFTSITISNTVIAFQQLPTSITAIALTITQFSSSLA